MRVVVRDNDVGKALRVLKRKLIEEGVLKEVRRREFFEKPCEKRVREEREARRRERKRESKRLEREGF